MIGMFNIEAFVERVVGDSLKSPWPPSGVRGCALSRIGNELGPHAGVSEIAEAVGADRITACGIMDGWDIETIVGHSPLWEEDYGPLDGYQLGRTAGKAAAIACRELGLL